MRKISYSEKLKDPRWQKKRSKVMEYANWRCQGCGTQDRTLHVHHSYYTRGKEPWQYPDGSLICICDKCHEKLHGKKAETPRAVKDPTPEPIVVPTDHEKARKFSDIFSALRKLP